MLIPILFTALLLLVQPAIFLYDRIVMQAAAAEGCRLLATKNSSLGTMTDSCEAFIRHRLGAIPPLDCFHVHGGGCSWDITFSGDEASEMVEVVIKNEARPLPLLDAGATLLGMTNASGNIEISATVSMPTQPGWVSGSEVVRDPSAWVGAWLR